MGVTRKIVVQFIGANAPECNWHSRRWAGNRNVLFGAMVAP